MEPSDVRGLLSVLLADGSLRPYPSPSGGYVQLVLTAGAKEGPFLAEKAAEIRQFLPTEAQIVPYRTAERSSGKCTDVLRFRVSTRKLRPIYNLLYPGGVRRITRNALEMLGARAAAWLWAEGARAGRRHWDLARVGRTKEEAALIAGWLEVLCGVRCELAPGVQQLPRLRFESAQAEKLKAALIDYAPTSRRHLFTEGEV